MDSRKRASAIGGNDSEPSKKRRIQLFKGEYATEWPVLKPSKVSTNHVYCSACCTDFSIAHGGRDDCRRHVATKRHQDYARMMSKSTRIDKFFQSTSSGDQGIIQAETLFTHFLIEHNIPLSAADHASK